ncbi:MAG: hypothetical protein M3384_21950 [Acidobacteriota bacterium]|nr:hypothetical protein [Acidobacteriota bacterium]
MKIPVGRPPVGAPDKVRRHPNSGGSKVVFDAKWDVPQAPPNTKVGLTAVSKITIEGASTAQIKIFHIAGGEHSPVAVLKAPYENGQVKTNWLTTPVKGGNFQTGEYYFEVSVNGYLGVTTDALVLRDASQRNVDSFQQAPAKPKVVF